MKTFKVIASYRTYVYTNVEAKDWSEAYDKARDMDGGDFERLKGEDLADWTIDDAIEVTS
jgi:hypothetical protein